MRSHSGYMPVGTDANMNEPDGVATVAPYILGALGDALVKYVVISIHQNPDLLTERDGYLSLPTLLALSQTCTTLNSRFNNSVLWLTIARALCESNTPEGQTLLSWIPESEGPYSNLTNPKPYVLKSIKIHYEVERIRSYRKDNPALKYVTNDDCRGDDCNNNVEAAELGASLGIPLGCMSGCIGICCVPTTSCLSWSTISYLNACLFISGTGAGGAVAGVGLGLISYSFGAGIADCQVDYRNQRIKEHNDNRDNLKTRLDSLTPLQANNPFKPNADTIKQIDLILASNANRLFKAKPPERVVMTDEDVVEATYERVRV